jgi:hypothetical protein
VSTFCISASKLLRPVPSGFSRLGLNPTLANILYYCSNLSSALANPSSWLEAVTNVAAFCTSLLALPIAMLTPLFLNISTSFGMSPIVAMRPGGIPQTCEKHRHHFSFVSLWMGEVKVVPSAGRASAARSQPHTDQPTISSLTGWNHMDFWSSLRADFLRTLTSPKTS